MPVPGWFRGKLRSRAKPKPGAAAVSSAATSPRKSVDLDCPSPSPSPTPRAREKARSLDSPAARHGRGGAELQYKLPVPVTGPDPLCEEAADAPGCSSLSGSSVCSSSDDAPDHHASRSMDPIAFAKGRDMVSDTAIILNEDKQFMSCSMPREHHKFFEAPVSNVRALHVHNDDPSTSEGSCSRGRMLTEDIFGPRTRSPSPGRKTHTFAMNNNVHSKEFGFSPRSPLKMIDGLRSPPHPLPLPPAPGACSPLPPSPTACSPLPPSQTACSPLPTSPTASSQSQSQWKKGKLLGSGTFGQVYLGFNSENGQFCAIKEVQVISDDPHSKERLKQLNQEIDMLKKASHPNVVQYYDSEMTDDTLSIYLEYVSAKTPPPPVAMERKQADYSNLDERYMIQGERYQGQQYSHIYYTRLHHMRTLLHALVPSRKPHLPVTTVLGLEEGKDCVLVGTLYKHMKLKPSILDEYSKERSTIPLVKPHSFMHSDDNLILEDESGRVALAGAIPPAAYVTGVVVALHGKETSAGNFLVEDVMEAGLPPQTVLPSINEDKYVVFVSGLSVGSSTFNPLQFQLLIDHITGHLGDENEQTIASKIVRVVVAGNSVHIAPRFLNGQTVATKDQPRIAEPIRELDIMLTQLVASLPVDIMPGCNDPANFSLPQQPLHRCLFSGASTYNTFSSCPNPHQFDLDNVKFIGTSGQNIDDLYRYSDAKDRLEFMERTLKWRHLAPTAPNSLGCYPYTDKDPFLVETCPHVYFVGNQDKYETRLLKGTEKQQVRLISIPRFCDSGIAVMLNLRNLECSTLSFSTSFDA